MDYLKFYLWTTKKAIEIAKKNNNLIGKNYQGAMLMFLQ